MTELPRIRFASNPLAILAVALASGVALGISPQGRFSIWICSGTGVALTVLALAFLARKYLLIATVFVISAFCFAGLDLSLINLSSASRNRISTLYERGEIAEAEPLELTATIEGQPEHAPQSFYLTLRAERLARKGIERDVSGTVLLRANVRDEQDNREYGSLELRHGARVRVVTALEREENFRNPGVLPFTEYLERKGFDATGVIKSPLLVERLNDAEVFLPVAWLYEWREGLDLQFTARFSAETAGVLSAAVLGNRYNISHGAAERFRAGGTFHVLVISGLQIAFIGGIFFLLARWITKRRFLQFLISTTFLWAFPIAVNAEAPVVRSALMFTLVVFAPIVWRRAHSLNVIGGAALALLIWRPGDLFDPSFQLTFASVLAIVLIATPLVGRMRDVGSWRPTHATPCPPECSDWFRTFSESLFWSEREWRAEMVDPNVKYRLFKTSLAAKLERWHCQRLLRFAVTAIVVSGSVQIGMLPLLIIYFHRISFASLLLNIFVGGLLAVLALVALAGILASQFSLWLAMSLFALAEKINWLMIHFVDPFSRLGVASMRLPHYSGPRAAIYIAYFLTLGFLIRRLAHWNPLRPGVIENNKNRIFKQPNRRFAAVAFLLTTAAIIFHPYSALRPDGKLHVDFLDVGQGDAALVTMPDGATLLIDGGGRPNINPDDMDGPGESFQPDTRSVGEAVVSEYLWSRGLDRVDYILATHADADHIDGLNDVARNFKVRGAIVARTPADDPEYFRFAETMKANGVPIYKVGTADGLRFGAMAADVLWPPVIADDNAPSRNNDGLVLRIRYGERTLLFAADIEKEAEAAVLNEGAALRSDVIKIAHHGSKTSSTAAFVDATKARLAIISVGRNSMFGHPNKEVVERWRASGAEVMTTGDKGTISIATDGHSLSVRPFVAR